MIPKEMIFCKRKIVRKKLVIEIDVQWSGEKRFKGSRFKVWYAHQIV